MHREAFADTHDFLSHLPGDSSASSLARTFSMNAFMISCWACLFSSVAAEHRAAFEQAGVRLLWKFAGAEEAARPSGAKLAELGVLKPPIGW